MTPPEPISASSGWAKITIARSGTSVTTVSFRVVRVAGALRVTDTFWALAFFAAVFFFAAAVLDAN
jgi:hypothetical protein